MRTSSLFLTLAYAAAMVMARPTIRSEAADAADASDASDAADAAEVTEVAEIAEYKASYTSCNRPGVFALTFDDGPAQYSWGLAKTLHDQGIKATFFINGANSVDVLKQSTTTEDGEKTYLEVIKQYYDQGHEVASHTYQHIDLKDLTAEQVEYQMNTQSDVIFKAIGKRPALMRPPEGVTDEVSAKVLKDLGYHNILWDIDTNDWRKLGLASQQKEVKTVLDKDIANVTMGHISLEHDIHEDTVTTLIPWLTKYIKSKGLEFVTVSDCIGVEPYKLDADSTEVSNSTEISNSTITATTAPTTLDSASTVDINLGIIDINLAPL